MEKPMKETTKNKIIYLGKRLVQIFFIGCFSGTIYTSLEVFFRGYTHWTMYWLAFVVGIFIFLVNNTLFEFDTDFLIQVFSCAGFATLMELIFGLIFNQDHSIWDYTGMFLNYKGQICLLFTIIWIIICGLSLILLDWIDWRIFKTTEKPYYCINNKKIYFY